MSASNTSRQYIVTQFYSNGIDLSDYIVKETIVKHTYPNGDVIQYCLYTNDQYGILYYSPFYKSIKRIFFEDKDTGLFTIQKYIRVNKSSNVCIFSALTLATKVELIAERKDASNNCVDWKMIDVMGYLNEC